MAISRPRKPNYLDKLFLSVLDANQQLHQARTAEEREFFTKQLQDLEIRRQEYLAKLAKARRARQETIRRKKLNLPPWQ